MYECHTCMQQKWVWLEQASQYIQLTQNVLWHGYNEYSSSNINSVFVQSHLVYNNILKALAWTHAMFFWNILVGC